MASSKQVLHNAKSDLVRDGISLLHFMSQLLSSVELNETAEDFEARVKASQQVERVMHAYIDNLKQVNRKGHDFLLRLPMLQVTDADESLCSEAVFLQFCPDLQDKYYSIFKQKCKNIEQSQAVLASAYEADGLYFDTVKSTLETVAITFLVLVSLIYLVSLGPLAGVIVAAALTLAAGVAWIAWEQLPNETRFSLMHTTIPEVVPAEELSVHCENWRFFTAYKEDSKTDTALAQDDDKHQSHDDLHALCVT